jgi:hypothetical protein
MSQVPETPRECSICKRVEQVLGADGALTERLSEHEIAELIKKVQYAILNKEEMKNTGGTNMSDEKYVISKASFEDFYETQDNLVSIIEKMVNRIEKQDQVIMKFGAALSGLLADQMDPEAPVEDEGADLVEEDVELGEDSEGGEVDVDDEIVDEEVGEEEEEEVPAEDEFAEKGPVEGNLQDMLGKAQKAAFEAGWKAREAELKKQNGIPVNVSEIPSGGNRPVPTADVQTAQVAGQVKKSFTDSELAKMTPTQVNQWLKEQGQF